MVVKASNAMGVPNFNGLFGGAFALFFHPHPGEFAHLFLKNANARGLARGGGMGTAGID